MLTQNIQLFALTKQGIETLTLPATIKAVPDIFKNIETGVYAAFRTFEKNKFLHLTHHIQRTEQAIQQLSWDITVNWSAVRQALDSICQAYPLENARVRLDVLPKPAISIGTNSRILITLSPMPPIPPHYYTEGVAVATAPHLQRITPYIKSASFVYERPPVQFDHAGIYEHLLLNKKGYILEGSSSNFYGIKDDILYTASAGILAGVTRHIIFQLAHQLNIEVKQHPIHINEINTLDEACMSSSSRGLVPIIKIDDTVISMGSPGKHTKTLWHQYQIFVTRHIQTAIES